MAAEYPALKWRLDFNESLEPARPREFLLGLAAATRAAIDFVGRPVSRIPTAPGTTSTARRG